MHPVPPADPATQEPLSVSSLTAQIKTLLEQGFSRVKLIGEVSRLTARSGGHIYFTIKDANAAIAAVIWRSTAQRLAQPPEEGKQYVFHGHLSLYPPQGRYQIVVSRVEAESGGELAAEFERRKRLFAERGWFDPEHKRPLPALPRRIGIVTSESAAALQDVRKVLATRPGWLEITLAPSVVQGSSAPPAIVKALRRLQAMQPAPDLILLVRGGGSPEDLWCFNDEAVVRAVAECSIPVISGIGHEIDVTLADYAADVQAATPSNAAELACPSSDTLKRQMPRIALLERLVDQHLSHGRATLDRQEQALAHRWRIERDERRMHVERSHHRLATGGRTALQLAHAQLRRMEKRLLPLEPAQQLRVRQRRLDDGMRRLRQAVQHRQAASLQALQRSERSFSRLREALLPAHRQQVAMQRSRLGDLNPLGVLDRGYALALDAGGRIVRSVQGLQAGDALDVRLHDGKARTTINEVDES